MVDCLDIGTLEEERDALVARRLFLNRFVLPDYESLNLSNIKSLVGRIFGSHSLDNSAIPSQVLDDFDGIERVFLIIMDGFGYNRLLTHIKSHNGALSELVEKGILQSLTSPFPATTSTSLASIFTGMPPVEHGIVGYQMFSREYGCVVNALDMKPVYGYSSEVEIARDLSRKVKPWMPVLNNHGVRTLVVTKASIVGSGLSRVIHADLDVIPYMLESEMFVKCRRELENQGPMFLALYYSGVDTLEHRYGPNSEEVRNEIETFDFLLKNFLKQLSDAAKNETLIILTSDHGVCETQRTIYVKDILEVASRLQLPPVGDSRAAFLYAKQPEKENLWRALQKELDGFTIMEPVDLIEAGAFGRTSDSEPLKSLIGDFAALSNGPNGLSYPYYENDRNREQNGGHGGMTAEEVLVPLLSMRLSKA
jgi:hypothetical protein